MKKGFTLIELLAAVLIMGILTAVALPQYRRSLERTRVAEALQMLPSIYDARERLVTENDWNWNAISTYRRVSFKKLDMEIKGEQQGTSGTNWKTDNFTYDLVSSCIGSDKVPYVSADMSLGAYKGTTLYYTGNTFYCNPGTVKNSCQLLNIPRLTKCTKNPKL